MRPTDDNHGLFDARAGLDRRTFITNAGLLVLGAAVSSRLSAADTVTLPFANGERELVKYPQKRPLIRLTSRPPQLETPFSVFNEGAITPNDAFFVRYHLANIPTEIDAARRTRFLRHLLGRIFERNQCRGHRVRWLLDEHRVSHPEHARRMCRAR